MDSVLFFKIYIPALEKAISNDHINLGFYVMGPEDYIDEKDILEIDNFIHDSKEFKDFFDSVGVYFDAKSHNFPNVQGKDIALVKNELLSRILEIKSKLG